MKTEVIHFTAERMVDFSFGWTWTQVVNEYLRTSYKTENSNSEVVVLGVTYKTLKRPGMTVFYDADGNTLFDVTNDRLEKEYEWLMNNGTGEAAENMDTGEEDDADGKDNPIVEQAETDSETGEAPATEREKEDERGSTLDMTGENVEGGLAPESPVTAEDKAADAQDGRSIKQWAEEKLKKEMTKAKDKSFADPIIGYLLERCREDEGLAEDIVQEHKTWQKCFDYIYSQARKQTKGNCAAVRDDVVYEWAEDYYHKDDKDSTALKAQKTAKDKKVKSATEGKAPRARGSADKVPTAPKAIPAKAPQEQPRPKQNSKDLDGQLDMFSMMTM